MLLFVNIKKLVKVRDDFILFTTYSSNLVSVSRIYIQITKYWYAVWLISFISQYPSYSVLKIV